jgi:tetratricopeptide (TPR) repeat protein
MSAKKTKLLLLIGALILFVLLYIAPKIKPANDENHDGQTHNEEKTISSSANLDVYLNLAFKNLDASQNKNLQVFVSKKINDSCITFWDKLKRPDLASYYLEEIAKSNPKAENWFKAGNRYYYAIQFSLDKTEVPVLYQCALRCFDKGLKLEPTNVDAKIMLASCYVEGTQEPMEGISRLKAIEKTDSNNVKLQLTFAFFSVKSGQLDKAISRFKKVLQVDSNYIEAYLHLADAYEQQSNSNGAILMLEKYASKTSDPTAKIEINKYIQQLKK